MMIRIRFSNTQDDPCVLQVDPWAGLYQVNQGEVIEIEAESESEAPRIEWDECGETKILTLVDSDEYYVIRSGKRYHWTDYPTNLDERQNEDH